ncbi:MAG: cytidine deaminase [Lachnospiraceae bacterium]|nr:cytidine deaminase [Lachnospiraceae bacterium]
MEWKSEYEKLVNSALEGRKNSYSPYSHFAVGAAVLGKTGEIFTGCNIENASYPVGICAERVAISKAVSEGVRSFKALAIAGGPDKNPGSDICEPCGLCRQFIREFVPAGFPIILAKVSDEGEIEEKVVYSLEELLPHSFGPDNLKG